ncbi:DUF3224 domain-containing protein [Modestobacter altitudinis]|uniref:DUF3224 domain-containing protein n=1 Tax=Modestobacter altitudinis TaxID=2213158 RepID=UPI00110D1C2D|nr:DUF3224 domain-containing protein [Modestobacter altitudinis]
MARIEATFEIVDDSEEVYDQPEAGPRLTRVTIRKRYSGVIEGHGVAHVLTAQGEGGAGYVASERVVGSLDGRRGSFVIQHGGSMDAGTPSTFGAVVPASGTDELAGLRGQASEMQAGVLTLDYSLDQ